MKNPTNQLSQTYIKMMFEAGNPATMQAVPPAKTLGNTNPVTGKSESGMHEYDTETGEKTKTYSSGDEFPDSDTRTPDERKQEDEENAELDRRSSARSNYDIDIEDRLLPRLQTPEDRKLAKRFPEAYPDSVVKLKDEEGNPTDDVVELMNSEKTTKTYSNEAMQQRLMDFFADYNTDKSWDENKERFKKGIPGWATDEDLLTYPGLSNKRYDQGDPFDTQTTTTKYTAFPLKENGILSFKDYLISQLNEAKTAAWQRKEGKDPEGGLNKKGVASYRRENPGSKLQTAVTEDPKKLKPGSKKAKRRKSFCKRMKGMKAKLTSAKTARDPDSRINKSLRKWNCE